MSSTIFENKEKLYAYLTIQDFFDTYSLEDALSFLFSILKAASTKKIWKKNYPFSVIHYIQQIEKITAAVFYIHENFAQRNAAIIKKDKRAVSPGIELLQGNNSPGQKANCWSIFPRHITLEQFYNPYLVIKSFCNYKSQCHWKNIFADIQEHALVNSPISNCHPPYNLLNIHRQLARLLEAIYLLEIRTNKEKQPIE